MNRKALESLVKAGAGDCFNIPRQRMMLIVDDAAAGWERGGESEFQRSFFDISDDDVSVKKSRSNLEKVDEWDLLTRLSFEKEMLGIYLSGHPLDNYSSTWRALVTKDSRSMGYQANDNTNNNFISSETKQVMGGLIIKTDWRVSKKQTVYGIITFEDLYGTYEILLWSDLVEKYRNLLKPGEIWFATGLIRTTFGKTSLSASNLFPADAAVRQATKLNIFIDKSKDSETKMKKLQQLIKKHSGSLPVSLKITNGNRKSSIINLPDSMLILPSEEFLREVERLFGESKVKIEN